MIESLSSDIKLIPQLAESKAQREVAVKKYMIDLGLTWEQLGQPKNKQILDIGAGRADFAKIAQTKDIQVTSVDSQPELWEKQGGIPTDVPYHIADASRILPFLDETFDAILARGVFYWTDGIEAVLPEIKRVLRRGGEFRFGPGIVRVNDTGMSTAERNKLWKYELREESGDTLLSEEAQEAMLLNEKYLLLSAKEQQLQHERETTPRAILEEREAIRLQESLEALRKIDPNITLVQGSGKEHIWSTYDNVYYVMKKT